MVTPNDLHGSLQGSLMETNEAQESRAKKRRLFPAPGESPLDLEKQGPHNENEGEHPPLKCNATSRN